MLNIAFPNPSKTEHITKKMPSTLLWTMIIGNDNHISIYIFLYIFEFHKWLFQTPKTCF